MPVVAPTVATVVVLLLHVPGVVASANVVEPPKHAEGKPVIAAIGLTVTITDDVHPVPAE